MRAIALILAAWLAALPASAQQGAFVVEGGAGTLLRATPTDRFDAPWAMTVLPDGRMLVTEKGGALVLVSARGRRLGEVAGVPGVLARGQGGLGDVVPHPDFARNGLVYLSLVERDPADLSLSGAVVIRGRLSPGAGGGTLSDLERVWTQTPKTTGNGHYGHRIAFGPDGFLYVTSGDRQKMAPAQDPTTSLGAIVRLTEDGRPVPGNPYAGRGGVSAELWTLGHRNPLGIAFDAAGRLWAHEMGPRGGDELNRIEGGANYGWPAVSEGRHYSGRAIPGHATQPAVRAPAAFWVPSVSPAGLAILRGDRFPGWRGDAVLGALSGRALVRVEIGADGAREAERFSWGARVREVEEGRDGAIWLLEDGPGGRLIHLTPA